MQAHCSGNVEFLYLQPGSGWTSPVLAWSWVSLTAGTPSGCPLKLNTSLTWEGALSSGRVIFTANVCFTRAATCRTGYMTTVNTEIWNWSFETSVILIRYKKKWQIFDLAIIVFCSFLKTQIKSIWVKKKISRMPDIAPACFCTVAERCKTLIQRWAQLSHLEKSYQDTDTGPRSAWIRNHCTINPTFIPGLTNCTSRQNGDDARTTQNPNMAPCGQQRYVTWPERISSTCFQKD